MFADLQLMGIIPLFSDSLQIRYMGSDSAALHSFRSFAGKLSGPAAELADKSLIASSMSVSSRCTFLSSPGDVSRISSFG